MTHMNYGVGGGVLLNLSSQPDVLSSWLPTPTGPLVTCPAQMPREHPTGVWPCSKTLVTPFRHGQELGDLALSGVSGSWWASTLILMQ